MTEIRRLTDSCLLVTTDDAASLFDPGFHPFLEGGIDLDSIGDVTRVLVTHEHGDHVHPDFVKWLIDRRRDLVVYSNQAVADLLQKHDIEVSTDVPPGVSVEDVLRYSVVDMYDASVTLGGFPFDNRFRWYTGSDNDLALNLLVRRIDAHPAAVPEMAARYTTTGAFSNGTTTFNLQMTMNGTYTFRITETNPPAGLAPLSLVITVTVGPIRRRS